MSLATSYRAAKKQRAEATATAHPSYGDLPLTVKSSPSKSIPMVDDAPPSRRVSRVLPSGYENQVFKSLRKRNPQGYLYRIFGKRTDDQTLSTDEKRAVRREKRRQVKLRRQERVEQHFARRFERSIDILRYDSRFGFFQSFSSKYPISGLSRDNFFCYVSLHQGKYTPSEKETRFSYYSFIEEGDVFYVIVDTFFPIPRYCHIVATLRQRPERVEEDLHLSRNKEEENKKRVLRMERRNRANKAIYVYSEIGSDYGNNHSAFDRTLEHYDSWSLKSLYIVKETREDIEYAMYHVHGGRLVERGIYFNGILSCSFINSKKGLTKYSSPTIYEVDGHIVVGSETKVMLFGLDMTHTLTPLVDDPDPGRLIPYEFVINKKDTAKAQRRRFMKKSHRLAREEGVDIYTAMQMLAERREMQKPPESQLYRTRYLAGNSEAVNGGLVKASFNRSFGDVNISFSIDERRRTFYRYGVKFLEEDGDDIFYYSITSGYPALKKSYITSNGVCTKIVLCDDAKRPTSGPESSSFTEKRSYGNKVVTWERRFSTYSYTCDPEIELEVLDDIPVEDFPGSFAAFTYVYVNCLFRGSLIEKISSFYTTESKTVTVDEVVNQMWHCLEKHDLSIYRSFRSSHELYMLLFRPASYRAENVPRITSKYSDTDRRDESKSSRRDGIKLFNGRNASDYPFNALIKDGNRLFLATDFPDRQSYPVPNPRTTQEIRHYFGFI